MSASRSLSVYLPPAIAFTCGLWIGSQKISQTSSLISAQSSFQQKMQELPLYNSLLNDSKSSSLHHLCPFDVIPDYLKERHLLAGALNGEDMLLTPPMIFVDEKRAELIGFYALGEGLSGHSNTVHGWLITPAIYSIGPLNIEYVGGMIAAIFDEMLAFTAMPQLPGRIFALTSYLTVRFSVSSVGNCVFHQ